MKDSYLVLKGGTLIDGNGGPPIKKPVLVMKGDRIESVGAQDETTIPEGAEVIDTSGKTIMPGMIDAHIHATVDMAKELGIIKMVPPAVFEDSVALTAIKSVIRVQKYLETGFTTVRDCGDIGMVAVAIRNAINLGVVKGPRMVACGNILSITAGANDWLPIWMTRTGNLASSMAVIADGVDGLIKAVRQQIKVGTDWIKIYVTGQSIHGFKQEFSDAELRAIIDEAHHKERPVSAHCMFDEGAYVAVNAGADSIEHGCRLNEKTIELMVKKGTYLVPTIYAFEGAACRGEELGLPQNVIQDLRISFESQRKSFRMAVEAGVKIAFGTDSGVPAMQHGTGAREFETLVENGLTPMQAIESATREAASLLRMEDKLGTLEAGKLADVIVVDGDPLKDISVLRDKTNIVKVYKEGKEVPRLNLGEAGSL